MGSLWTGLDAAGQEAFKKKAADMPRVAPSPSPPHASDNEEITFPLKSTLKNETAIRKVAKLMTDEFMVSMMSELRKGVSLSVGKEGKLKASEPDLEGTITITFKPTKAK